VSAWPALNAHGFNAGNSEPESLEQRRVVGDSLQGGDQGEASEATDLVSPIKNRLTGSGNPELWVALLQPSASSSLLLPSHPTP